MQKGGDPGAQFAELAHKTRVAIERRVTERELEERELRFRALIRNSSDVIRIIDRDGLIAYDSDSGPRILGYPPGSVLGQSPLEFVHPDDRELVRDALAEVFAGTSPGTPTGFRVRHGDGRWVAVESVAANLLGAPGVDGIVTTTWPVEARRRAEEALLQSERRFRRAEEIAGLGHWELDLETGTIHASSGAQSLYGLYGDERPLADVQELPLPRVPPPARPGPPRPRGAGPVVRSGVRHPPRRRRARAGAPIRRRVRPGPADRLRHPARHHRPETGRGRPPGGRGRYGALAEDMPVYFCTFLPDGTLTYVNTALAAMNGQPSEALVGRTFFEMISPEDDEAVRAGLAGLTPERPVETHEQSDRAPDGTQRWQQWTNRAVYDADGRLVRFQAVGLDITDLRETEAALSRANRALTLLSGITRHDIDNQLAVLRGFLSLARAEEGSPAVAAFLERSMAAGERIATLIRFTGAWEGMGARPPAWLDARAVVEDAAREVDRRDRARGKRPADGPPRLGGPDLHPGRGRPHRERAPPRRLGHDGPVLGGGDRGRRPR